MTVTCPKCNRIFRDRFNLQRHLSKQQDCAATTNATTQSACVELLDTLFRVLRGPLRLDESLQHDDDYVVAILHDVWRAITAVCKTKPARSFDLILTLLELLNGRQLELLYGRVMVESNPPLSSDMLKTLRAVYAHTMRLHRKGVPSLHRKSVPNVLRAMTRLPGLVELQKIPAPSAHDLFGGGNGNSDMAATATATATAASAAPDMSSTKVTFD
jgi:hypothetical protein